MSDTTGIAAAKAELAAYDAVWCPECSLERHDADTPHGGEGYPVDFMARHLRAVLAAYDAVVAERDALAARLAEAERRRADAIQRGDIPASTP